MVEDSTKRFRWRRRIEGKREAVGDGKGETGEGSGKKSKFVEVGVERMTRQFKFYA